MLRANNLLSTDSPATPSIDSSITVTVSLATTYSIVQRRVNKKPQGFFAVLSFTQTGDKPEKTPMPIQVGENFIRDPSEGEQRRPISDRSNGIRDLSTPIGRQNPRGRPFANSLIVSSKFWPAALNPLARAYVGE
jgi:hypothetical protein